MGINRSAQGGGDVATEPGPLGPTPAFLGTTPVLLQLLGGGGWRGRCFPPPPQHVPAWGGAAGKKRNADKHPRAAC